MPAETDHTARVRRLCLAMPGTSEKLSHGEPTFFVAKRVFAALSTNHHDDGHVAVLIPTKPGEQEALIDEAPGTYYRPPYVGHKGWVGVELAAVNDEVLGAHLSEAYKLIQSKAKRA